MTHRFIDLSIGSKVLLGFIKKNGNIIVYTSWFSLQSLKLNSKLSFLDQESERLGIKLLKNKYVCWIMTVNAVNATLELPLLPFENNVGDWTPSPLPHQNVARGLKHTIAFLLRISLIVATTLLLKALKESSSFKVIKLTNVCYLIF